jgi:hypothetical protein
LNAIVASADGDAVEIECMVANHPGHAVITFRISAFAAKLDGAGAVAGRGPGCFCAHGDIPK